MANAEETSSIGADQRGGLVPIPFEQFATTCPSPWVISDTGINRAPRNTCMIRAADDVEALQAWLSNYENSPRTLRSYRKEIARFYNWLALIRHISLSSVTADDVKAYKIFARKPLASWCGNGS